MKNNIFYDIKMVADLFVNIRKARKEGTQVEVREVVKVPFNTGIGILNTVEGRALWNHNKKLFDAVQVEFNKLTQEEKHKLSFVPKDNEFVERAYIWRTMINSVLPPDDCRKAMITILHQYIHIKHLR